jgi:hypothetical protein
MTQIPRENLDLDVLVHIHEPLAFLSGSLKDLQWNGVSPLATEEFDWPSMDEVREEQNDLGADLDGGSLCCRTCSCV